MTLQTLTTISDSLQNDYDELLQSQVFSKHVLLDKLSKGAGITAMENNTFLIKLKATGHSGVYTDDGNAGADLITGQPTYDEATVPARYAYGTHQLTDSLLSGAKGKPGSIVNIAEDFAMEVKLSLQKSLNRQFLGRGGTEANNATIAIVNGASAATTVTLHNGSGSPAAGPGLGTWFMYPGSQIDIGTDAEHGAGTDDQEQIASVDSVTQITLESSATIADGDLVKFRSGDNTEMNGMRSIISASNTFQNVDRSSNYWAQAFLNNTAEALEEGDMIEAQIEGDKMGEINAILTGDVMYRKYGSLLTSMKRTATSKEVLGGGFTGLEFASGGTGTAVTLDHDVSYGDMHFISLNKNAITRAELDMGWLDQGAGMFQRTNLRASWWASYKYYGNLAVRNYRAHTGLQAKTA